jgi:hypothetical protein
MVISLVCDASVCPRRVRRYASTSLGLSLVEADHTVRRRLNVSTGQVVSQPFSRAGPGIQARL